jgi:glutathione S-transferase
MEIACGDIMGMAGKAQYAPGGRTEAMDEMFDPAGTDKSKNLCVIFGILEDKIGDSGFFGSEAMVGDACVAANVKLMLELQADCLEKFPKLAALVKTFDENEGVKKHAAHFPYPYFKRRSDE